MLKGRRIFVSGGSGVIGTALVDKLHQHGAMLYVGDLKPRPCHWPPGILYRQGDLNTITEAELDDFEPEYFFHLAATFERSVEPYEFWDENRRHNVRLSSHLMSLLKDSGSLRKVVFASSYLVYDKDLYTTVLPPNAAVRLRESDPVAPRNLTGASKLYHEIELRFLEEFKKHQFEFITARIFRSYGRHSRDVISRWIRALVNDEEIIVYAKEGLFDYVFADDVAQGLVMLADTPGASGIVNLGRGRARSVGEVIEVLRKHFPAMKYREEKRDISYEASEADMARFMQLTGWAPARDLETTIPEMIECEREALKRKEHGVPAFNVLVTSISKKVPLLKAVKSAVVKVGSETSIIGGDSASEPSGKYFVDRFWQMPQTNEENRGAIVEFIRKNNVRAIVPTRDAELLFWSNLKSDLPGTNIMVSDASSVELCLDKLMFYQRMRALGFPVIHTTDHVHDRSLGTAVVVKERFGAGSFNTRTNVSKDEAAAHAAGLSKPIFQPYVEGTEYSVDVYVSRNGRAKGGIVRRRDVVVSGESQVTTTVEKPELLELSLHLAEALKLYGHAVIQIIQQGNANFILECNCRLGGSSTLSVSAGLDSLYWFMLESVGVDVADYPFVPDTMPRRQVRYPEDLVLPLDES